MKRIILLFCLFGFLWLNAFAQAPDEFSFKKSYALTTPAKISVKTNDGFIRMNSGQTDQIEVYFIVKKDNRLQKISLEELEEELNVEINGGSDHFEITISQKESNRMKIWRDRYNVSLQINAPRNSSCALYTSDGNIDLTNFTGEQFCKTSDGNISAENVQGSLSAQTSDGNINISDIKGNAELRTSDGDINTENIQGDVNCKTSDGNIRMETTNGDVDAVTSDGDIYLNQVTGNNTAQTSDGHIRFENMQGALNAHTSDGDIQGNFTKLSNDLYLKTSDGNISVTIPDGMGIDLALRGEDINTKLDNFSGDTDKHRINGKIRGGGITVNLSTSDGNVNLNYH